VRVHARVPPVAAEAGIVCRPFQREGVIILCGKYCCSWSHWHKMLFAPMLSVCSVGVSFRKSTRATVPDERRASPMPDRHSHMSVPQYICYIKSVWRVILRTSIYLSICIIPDAPGCRSLRGCICREVSEVVDLSASAILVDATSPRWLSPRSSVVRVWLRLRALAIASPPSLSRPFPYKFNCLIDVLLRNISPIAVPPLGPGQIINYQRPGTFAIILHYRECFGGFVHRCGCRGGRQRKCCRSRTEHARCTWRPCHRCRCREG